MYQTKEIRLGSLLVVEHDLTLSPIATPRLISVVETPETAAA